MSIKIDMPIRVAATRELIEANYQLARTQEDVLADLTIVVGDGDPDLQALLPELVEDVYTNRPGERLCGCGARHNIHVD